MPITGRPAAPNRPMARRLEVRRKGSGRRVATVACVVGLGLVALLGTLHPLPVAGDGGPAATGTAIAAATSGVAGVSVVWSGADPTSDINWLDLITKGTIVLVLLFITLRVLGRMQASAPKRGGRLEVLESRPLAPKASLHLVAIGDRRLVVGLTPSGMVSLAELDATELTAEEEAADTAADGVSPETARGARRMGGTAQPTLGSALNYALGTVDSVSGRLATFLGGGRVR